MLIWEVRQQQDKAHVLLLFCIPYRMGSHAVNGLSDKFALVVQALKALGKDNIDDATLEKLSSILSPEEKTAFLKDTQHRKAWINRIAKELAALGWE